MKLNFLLIVVVLTICSCTGGGSGNVEDKRPNILLIVADDLGYADLGCYGGDIETPNIDKLALSGVRFSNFHTASSCAPTRAMLLSGNDNHIAGMGMQSLVTNEFGYEGKLSDRVLIIPQVLKNAGYFTSIAGKWHLGKDSLSNPFSKGFDRSFVNVGGAGTHYDDQSIFKENSKTIYTENGHIATWPKGAYSTDFYTDKIIQYMEESKAGGEQPFFVFAAYTSPHWPLQVDEKFWKKYEGRYDDGYEHLKQKRLESLKNTGMISETAVLPPNHDRVVPWDQLTDEEKKKEARKMELYAGMVDNLDYNVGRLMDYLAKSGDLENTLIVFMSDNGSAAEDFFYNDEYGPFIREHFNDDYEQMGQAGSFISYGPQWAEAGSSPFRYFKGEVTEGGIITPMIISGPGINKPNEIIHKLVTVMDLAPFFYEIAKTSYPKNNSNKTLYPLKGKSLVDLLNGKSKVLHDHNYVFGLEHNEKAMIRKGDWKIVNNNPPFNRENFKLYHLSEDLTESNDLKEKHQEKYIELMNEWDRFTKETKVQFPKPKGEGIED